VREEVRAYFTGDRVRDLAPFLPEERAVAADEWEREERRRQQGAQAIGEPVLTS
jgi:hypothetical protein